jgi:[ribosomal protein S5]-alanine N-acetyltransferase
VEIPCGVCILRPWRRGDEPALIRHANSREIWLNLRDQFPHPYTDDDAVAWIEFASAQIPPTSFAIEVGEAVGGVSLKLHDDVERVSAEMGYWLGESHWNKGIMTAAVRGATSYAFEQFSLTRIFAVPYASNLASQRVLEKAGYVREGVLRRSAIKDGNVLDQVLFAITDLDREHAGRDRSLGGDARPTRG